MVKIQNGFLRHIPQSKTENTGVDGMLLVSNSKHTLEGVAKSNNSINSLGEN